MSNSSTFFVTGNSFLTYDATSGLTKHKETFLAEDKIACKQYIDKLTTDVIKSLFSDDNSECNMQLTEDTKESVKQVLDTAAKVNTSVESMDIDAEKILSDAVGENFVQEIKDISVEDESLENILEEIYVLLVDDCEDLSLVNEIINPVVTLIPDMDFNGQELIEQLPSIILSFVKFEASKELINNIPANTKPENLIKTLKTVVLTDLFLFMKKNIEQQNSISKVAVLRVVQSIKHYVKKYLSSLSKIAIIERLINTKYPIMGAEQNQSQMVEQTENKEEQLLSDSIAEFINGLQSFLTGYYNSIKPDGTERQSIYRIIDTIEKSLNNGDNALTLSTQLTIVAEEESTKIQASSEVNSIAKKSRKTGFGFNYTSETTGKTEVLPAIASNKVTHASIDKVIIKGTEINVKKVIREQVTSIFWNGVDIEYSNDENIAIVDQMVYIPTDDNSQIEFKYGFKKRNESKMFEQKEGYVAISSTVQLNANSTMGSISEQFNTNLNGQMIKPVGTHIPQKDNPSYLTIPSKQGDTTIYVIARLVVNETKHKNIESKTDDMWPLGRRTWGNPPPTLSTDESLHHRHLVNNVIVSAVNIVVTQPASKISEKEIYKLHENKEITTAEKECLLHETQAEFITKFGKERYMTIHDPLVQEKLEQMSNIVK